MFRIESTIPHNMISGDGNICWNYSAVHVCEIFVTISVPRFNKIINVKPITRGFTQFSRITDNLERTKKKPKALIWYH